jgi:hypothetical protein
MNSVRIFLLGVAGAGLVACLAWHAASLLGSSMLNPSGPALVGVMLLVHIFNVFQLLPFGPAVRQSPIAGWRLALEGAPRWMKGFLVFASAYVIVPFSLGALHTTNGLLEDPLWAGRVLSAVLALFYGWGFVSLFAAVARANADAKWVCANGHHQDAPVLECPRCHAPVHALFVRPGA